MPTATPQLNLVCLLEGLGVLGEAVGAKLFTVTGPNELLINGGMTGATVFQGALGTGVIKVPVRNGPEVEGMPVAGLGCWISVGLTVIGAAVSIAGGSVGVVEVGRAVAEVGTTVVGESVVGEGVVGIEVGATVGGRLCAGAGAGDGVEAVGAWQALDG